MRISVIICTKNRAQELTQCIKSVIAQSHSPDEIIIVDASDTEETYLKIKEQFPQDSRFRYVHTKPALTYQRNIGVRNSSGDIIFFLDDDMVLDKDFIKEIVKVFEKDSEKKIGGVMGDIVNSSKPKNILKNIRTNLHVLLTRIFLLPTSGNGRFRSSGCPTFIHGAKEIRNVEFLSGGLTAYRKEVFKNLKFDEDFLEAHLYTDDEDFSYRVSQKYQNVYTPYAKLVHNPSPIGREKHYTRAKMTIVTRYYLLKKNFPRTLKHTLAFWWSVVGYLIQAITTMDKESIKGVISGIANIKKVAYTYLH
jgi:glycosyltransferase involved in cell wall biosynthesis